MERNLVFLCIFLLLMCDFSHAADISATFDSANGTSGFSFRDSAAVEMAKIDSDGNLQIKGGMRLDSAGTECSTAEILIVDGKIGIGTDNPLHG
ncbi:MAG: hypothetical protein PHQ23_03600 [Candidatus Wallbacteria bacterium]|nr:hypothetical protein [Candidatus Wallbacteria bacterium]